MTRCLYSIAFIFNLFDMGMTLTLVNAQLAREVNPVMAVVLELGPWYFVAAKFILFGLCLVMLWRYREHPLALKAIWACVVVYGFVCCQQFWLLNKVLGNI
jgi:hypothetical protein